MPSFDQLILSAPLGFTNSCIALNSLAELHPDVITQITEQAWNEIVHKQSTNIDKKYLNEKRTVSHIVKSMKQATPTPGISAAAKVLAVSTFLNTDTIEKILLKVKEISSIDNSDVSEVIKSNTGKLENFQWRIGMSVASNTCSNLYAPYIAIRFDIRNNDGTVLPYTAELTYQQFKELKDTFEKVGKIMDRL